MTLSDEAIRAVILGLLAERAAGRSICPSDAARALCASWRVLMPDVRRVAGCMAAAGEIMVAQGTQAVDVATARGPVRLRVAPRHAQRDHPDMPSASIPTPIGAVTVTEEGGRIVRLTWGGGRSDTSPLVDDALAQLAAYFGGTRRTFDLPLDFGTGFQADVLRALTAIPFGQTRTYGDLAKTLGVSAQAIGQACGANRIPILIPCHRVLAQCGLGGYSGKGGIETKVALLRLESAASLLI